MLISFSSMAEEFGKITITIEGIKNTKGTIKLALAYNEKKFNSVNLIKKAFRVESLKISARPLNFTFDKIPYGTYALSVFHDENDNNDLDRDLFDAPLEGYGYSNNPKKMERAATFKESQFEFKSNLHKLTIKLNN